jgi:outer membrane protein assembly factor BamB
MANSGQSLVGPVRAKRCNKIVTQAGTEIGLSSTVLGRDGSVYIGTGDPSASELVRLDGSSGVVLQRVRLGGVLSTPAVDQAGNVYIARMTTDGSGAHLVSFSSNLQQPSRFDVALPNARSVSSPKILSLTSGSLIFEAYTAGYSSLLIVNEKGQKLMSDETMCSEVVNPGWLPGVDYGVSGINIAIGQDPAVGIGNVNNQLYLVLASNFCAIQFYYISVGSTSASVQLTRFASADADPDNEKIYGDPAVSPDGSMVINDSDNNITAYDITTGKQKWPNQNQISGFLFSTPVLVPLVGKVYVLSSDALMKIDVATGNVEGDVQITGQTQASPAAAGEFILVSTDSGLSTFDMDLRIHGSTQLPGGLSSPAIGSGGEVYVGANDGKLFIFPCLQSLLSP